MQIGTATGLKTRALAGSSPAEDTMQIAKHIGTLTQLAGYPAFNRVVAGSTPAGPTKLTRSRGRAVEGTCLQSRLETHASSNLADYSIYILAPVAELVDAADSKSVVERRAGSTPARGTTIKTIHTPL